MSAKFVGVHDLPFSPLMGGIGMSANWNGVIFLAAILTLGVLLYKMAR